MAEFLDRYGFFCLIAALALAAMFWRARRVDAILSAWASANHVEIVSRSRGAFRGGPFFFTLSHQVVYLLAVRNQQGLERNCWVRLGSFFGGLLSDKVEAKWEQSDRFKAPFGGSRAT